MPITKRITNSKAALCDNRRLENLILRNLIKHMKLIKLTTSTHKETGSMKLNSDKPRNFSLCRKNQYTKIFKFKNIYMTYYH